MCKSIRALVSLIIATIGLVGADAQSLPHGPRTPQKIDLFAHLHDSLDRKADDILSRSTQQFDDLHHANQFGRVLQTSDVRLPDGNSQTNSIEMENLTTPMRRLAQLRPVLDPILQKEGIPRDLSFVVVVESGGKADARSPKGALGLWQLMPQTARRYGLIVDSTRDERLDIAKSTRAAAQYLRHLHGQFNSWPLALAAYNAGERRVQKAIRVAQRDDFTVLSARRLLPAETRSYVPSVLSLFDSSALASYDPLKTSQRSQQGPIVYAFVAE
jgi:Transglycosylase SLT domain